eukprot:7377917-Prymnesium_polylepis.1
MGFFAPPPPPPQSECIVCMEAAPNGRGLLCNRGRGGDQHFLCDGCFDSYVAEQGTGLREVTNLAEEAASARDDERRLAFLHGR